MKKRYRDEYSKFEKERSISKNINIRVYGELRDDLYNFENVVSHLKDELIENDGNLEPIIPWKREEHLISDGTLKLLPCVGVFDEEIDYILNNRKYILDYLTKENNKYSKELYDLDICIKNNEEIDPQLYDYLFNLKEQSRAAVDILKRVLEINTL